MSENEAVEYEESETEEVVTDPGSESEASWRDFIHDDKLRGTADKYNSLDDLISAYNSMGGEMRNRIKVPDENATEEDIAQYRKQLGVPGNVDEYEVRPMEDYEFSDSDLDVIEDMKEWALDHNIPAGAFESLVHDWVSRTQGIQEEMEKMIEAGADQAQQELYTKWGADFEKNINNAGLAAKTFGGDEFIEFLDDAIVEGFGKLGDHPMLVEFMAKIGNLTGEGTPLIGMINPQEAQSAQQRIDEIMRENPPGTSGYAYHAQELDDLFKKVAGNKPIGDR